MEVGKGKSEVAVRGRGECNGDEQREGTGESKGGGEARGKKRSGLEEDRKVFWSASRES